MAGNGKYSFCASGVRREDAPRSRCNLFRVVTTFLSRDVSELDSQTDFYFKARDDRLCGAARRRVYYLNSRVPDASRSKNRIPRKWRKRESLTLYASSVYVNLRIFSPSPFFYTKKETRQDQNMYIRTQRGRKSIDCSGTTGEKRIFSLAKAIRFWMRS